MKKVLVFILLFSFVVMGQIKAEVPEGFQTMGCFPSQDFVERYNFEYEEIKISNYMAMDLNNCTEIDYADVRFSNICAPDDCSWGGYIVCGKEGCSDKVEYFILPNNTLRGNVCGSNYQCMATIRDSTDGGLLKVTTDKMKVFCCSNEDVSRLIPLPTESFRGCGDITEREEREACERCVGTRKDPRGAVWTEIGCIDPSPAGLITRIFQIGLGIMGGIAVLRFIHIAIMYQSGDAQKIQDAREGVISLITGIIILSLGVVILQFLGINILGLPAGFLGG